METHANRSGRIGARGRRAKGLLFSGLILAMAQVSMGESNFSFTTVGAATHAGSAEIPPGEIKLKGQTASGSPDSDAVLLAETKASGDFDARAGSLTLVTLADSGWTGIMARLTRAPDEPFVALLTTKQGGCFWRYRTATGAAWADIPVRSGPVTALAMARTQNGFSALVKPNPNAPWQGQAMSLNLAFPDDVLLSLALGGGAGTVQEMRFSDLNGFPAAPSGPEPCAVYSFPFDDGRSPATLGFSPLRNVQLKTGETFVRTTTPGGASLSSLLGVPMTTLPVSVDTVQIRFRLRADRGSGPELRAYLIYGKDGLELRDRAKTGAGTILSGAGAILGVDAIQTGSIEAKGSLTLRDRAKVSGNVTVGGSVLRGNSTVITGTVKTGASVPLPTLPETTWTAGSLNVTVNPDQTKELAPGNYGTLTVYSRAKLHFQAGVYRFASVWIDTDVKWYVHNTAFAGTEVFANTGFRLGDRDTLIPSDTSGGPILRAYSNQIGELRLGTDMTLYGEFLFPKANLVIPSRTTTLRGGLYAKTVLIEPDAVVKGASDGILTDTLRLTVQGAGGNPFVLEQWITGGRGDLRDKLRIKTPGGTWTEKTLSASSPAGAWQTWDLRLVPASQGRGFRWLHDFGGGLAPALSGSGALGGDSLRSVKIEYLAQPGRLNRQISLDDIRVGCLNPACASLLVLRQPADTVLWEGGNARFEVEMASPGLGYQWYANGTPMPNEASPRLNIIGAGAALDGTRYRCRIRSNCDSIWSREAVLTVRPCGTIAIWAQPQSRSVREGGRAVFRVNAGGVGHFDYAWYRNGLPTEHPNQDSLVVDPAGLQDNGAFFHVKVSDGCGRYELSDPARLAVLADSSCRIAAIYGPDTLPAGRVGAYEIRGACPGGSRRYSVDQGAWKPLSQGGLAVIGPFGEDSSGSSAHVLRVIASNAYGGDTLEKNIVVVAARPLSQSLSVTGSLKDQNGAKADGLFQFEAQLYDRERGGRCLHRESFARNPVPVLDGEYTLALGTGEGGDSLAAVLRRHPHVFLDIQAGRYGVLEPIVDKLPLTAAPLVQRSQP